MNNTAWKPGQIANIGGLRECLRGKGETVLREALLVLGCAYKGEVLRYAGTLFPGIGHIVGNEHQRVPVEKFGARMIEMVKATSQREWAARIIKLAPEHYRGRRGAAWQVFTDAWRAASPAPVVVPAQRAKTVSVILDPGEIGWCVQCDKKVSDERAARCTDRHCSMRKAKAA
jgi:hypothetical protein